MGDDAQAVGSWPPNRCGLGDPQRRGATYDRWVAGDPDIQALIDQAVDGLLASGGGRREELDPGVVAGIVTATLREAGARTAESLRAAAPGMLAEHRAIRAGFEKRLADLWGPGLDALETVIVAAFEAGENVAKRERMEGDDPQVEALVLIHARACLVASEILSLLRSGHASGALGRWRTLHELAVVALFLHDKDRRTAELYLVHAELLNSRRLGAYQQHAETLGEVPFTPDEVAAIEARRAEILADVANRKVFESSWGWAAEALANPSPNFIPKFTDIQSAVDLDRWRPWVAAAHLPVHAGAAGSMFDIGRDGPLLLAGPSNAGLGIPGHNAAISLQLATVALLMHQPSATDQIFALAINRLVDDVGEAFARCETEYERRTEGLAPDHRSS